MRQIWHIAKKDLRELRGTMVAYIALIAVKLLLGAWLVRSSAADPAIFGRVQGYGNLCIGLEVLMGYVVVAAFVHENPLIGTRAEWLTRPISGGQLLAAKLLGLGFVMILVPLALSLPWWLGSGYDAHEIGRAAAETLLRQAVVIVPAFALAVLTDGFDRYVIWLLVLFGLGFCASKLPPVKAAMSTPDVAETREWLSLGVATATALLVVMNQFFTRRTGRGVALLVVGLTLTALAAWWWPRSFAWFRPTGNEAGSETVRSDQITLVFERARVVTRPDQGPELRVGLAVHGVPPDIKLRGGRADQAWLWSGVKIERSGKLTEESYGSIAPSLRALGLEVPRLDPAWFQPGAERPLRMGLLGQPIVPEGVGLNVQTAMRPAYLARMRREVPAYDITARLELFRPEVRGEHPLETNGRIYGDDTHGRIAHLMRVGNGLRVTVVEYSPSVNWGSPGRYVGTGFGELEQGVEYFLVNRSRGSASRGQELAVQQARFGTVLITWRTLYFSAPSEWIAGAWVEVPGWFQNLTVAKMVNRRVGEVQRTLHLDELIIAEDK